MPVPWLARRASCQYRGTPFRRTPCVALTLHGPCHDRGHRARDPCRSPAQRHPSSPPPTTPRGP
eukprot:3687242-Prymnesium_polylepis.1